MEDFEKFGVFYLGAEYDLEQGSLGENLILYDSKDLTTHAVCVGMTGSGKTGLCISLLEESLIDGIPAIVIDPKGDLCNLLLTFPELRPEDFLPWINPEDAQKLGLTPEEFSQKQAELWEKGLADWGQGKERIRKFRNAGELAVYTPGSDAGLQVSILKSFAAPDQVVREDDDIFQEKINNTVTSLLSLIGIEADPIQSREHILLSTILHSVWRDGQDLDLAGFIHAVQKPSFTKVGIFDLESFFPAKDRFALAMRMNSLLAAPGWRAWFEGEPLEIDRFLYTKEGKPRISIFHISHLGDAERMFFVSVLLGQMLDWMRRQSGTSSLRAILYMDEIYGYLPPVSNPPSKTPMLTLLKQARAFGLGIVLATQNPVDLDYKGLSNAGTWFIGRLQTDRDKERLLDGLEGVGGSGAGQFDRQVMSRVLAGLGSRVFLMHNVHNERPVTFQTRWAMSYLRGPITRSQIKQLNREASPGIPEEESVSPGARRVEGIAAPAAGSLPPIMPPGINQCFIAAGKAQPAGSSLVYNPVLLGSATVYYRNAKAGIDVQRDVSILAKFTSGSAIDWDKSEDAALQKDTLQDAPSQPASFTSPPKEAMDKRYYTEWTRSFKDWIYRSRKLELFSSPSLKMTSMPGEEERDFRIRLQMAAREKRDELVEKLRRKYQDRTSRLQERIRTAEHAIEREQEQAKQQKMQTAISLGTTLFSVVLGSKKWSRSSVGRASTTASRAGRILKETKDVERAEEKLEDLHRQVAELESRMAEEIAELQTSLDPLTEKLETFTVVPTKSAISVSLVTLAWAPYWKHEEGGATPAW